MTTFGQSFDWERWNDDKTFYESRHPLDDDCAPPAPPPPPLDEVGTEQKKAEPEVSHIARPRFRAFRMQVCCILTAALGVVGAVGVALYVTRF